MLTHANQVLHQAADRFVNAVAGFIPGLLALLMILLLTVMVAFLARAVLRRMLLRFRFDDRVTQWGLPEVAGWEPARSPSTGIAQLSFWIIVLLGSLAGVSALDPGLTSILVVRLFNYLPKVAAATVVLIAGFLLARFLARSVLIGAVNLQIQSARLLSLGGEMAGNGVDVGDGDGSLGNRRPDRTIGFRDSLRRNRAHAGAGGGLGFEGNGEPVMGAADGYERSASRGAVSSFVERRPRGLPHLSQFEPEKRVRCQR